LVADDGKPNGGDLSEEMPPGRFRRQQGTIGGAPAMKARDQFQAPRPIRAADGAELYGTESAPNSSTILAVTVLAGTEDVLAVIRTAALLGKSFKAATSINVLGERTIRIEPEDDLPPASLARVLEVVESILPDRGPAAAPMFALEVSITAASFLAGGMISVHVRGTDGPMSERAAIAR
jgi:hypothetical protein